MRPSAIRYTNAQCLSDGELAAVWRPIADNPFSSRPGQSRFGQRRRTWASAPRPKQPFKTHPSCWRDTEANQDDADKGKDADLLPVILYQGFKSRVILPVRQQTARSSPSMWCPSSSRMETPVAPLARRASACRSAAPGPSQEGISPRFGDPATAQVTKYILSPRY